MRTREGACGCTPGAVDPEECLLRGDDKGAQVPHWHRVGVGNGFYAGVKHRGLAGLLVLHICLCVCVRAAHMGMCGFCLSLNIKWSPA